MLSILWTAWTFPFCLPRALGKRLVPYRHGGTVTGTTCFALPSDSGFFLPVTLAWGTREYQLKALVDSGAAGNFMDLSLARGLQIPSDSLATPLTVTALDGRPLGPGKVTLLTSPLRLSFNQHQEELSFHLIQSPELPVILGHPWLLRHNPHLDWSSGAVLSWSPTCRVPCLGQRPPDPVLESQDSPDLSLVPSQ